MVCYTHRNNRAIGICKYCGKAVCDECAIINSNGITCSTKCHQESLAYAKVAKSIYSGRSKFIWGVIVFLFFTGIIFLVLGLLAASEGEGVFALIFFVMAGLSVLFGSRSYINIR